ncbi:MAG: hypothetical protein ACKOF7_14060, partial [Phycisphaerales bacterium]
MFVLLVSAFIIAEASSVPMKFKVAFPNAASNSALATVTDKVKSFVIVITELNVALAAAVGAMDRRDLQAIVGLHVFGPGLPGRDGFVGAAPLPEA